MHRRILTKLSKRGGQKLLLGLAAAAVVVSGATFVAALPSSTGLVAHWSFDQSSGTTLTDDSGNGHHGTLTGAPAWAAGKINNALDYDGPDVAEVGDISAIDNVSQVTLAAWIKRTATGSAVLLGKQTTVQDLAIEAWYDGNVYFQLSNGSDTYGYLPLDDTNWHHVALVFDGTQTGNANRLKAYVDGTQETLTFNGTVGTTTTSDTTPFNIGKIGPDYTYGMIDDVWLYSRALSQSEVQELHDLGTPDTTAPSVPQNLEATAVSHNQINLAWDASTDNVGVTGYRVYRNGVEQGTTSSTTYQDTGLSASTSYSYTVRAYDAATNQSSHSTADSATTSAAPDTTAPTISVTAPADEATVDGTVSVTANASDNVGVTGVKFYAGSTQIGSEDTSSPYSVNWDTTTVANGSVELTAVARDAANNTTTSSAVTVTVDNPVTSSLPYVTSISSNGRYFTDQNDDPILIKGDSPWSMFTNLSPTQVEGWADNREGHGYNTAIISLIGNTTNGAPYDNGDTYDHVNPFVSGDVTDWNETYWDRVENYMTILKDHGITVFLYPIDGWTTLPGGVFDGVSNADAYTFGQMVADRFENYPNIVWMVGGDYNGYDDTINGQMENVISGIRSTSDTRILSGQWNSGTISTDVEGYEPLMQWNFAYAYSPIYHNLFRAYQRTGTNDPRPALFSESNYEGEGDWDSVSSTNETFRRQELWALTSGSPGSINGSQDWRFMEDWEERLDSTVVTQSQKLRAYFENLTNWQLLVPDDTDPFVTAGRGTKDDAETYIDVLQNDYVTAAQTPDESLSVVYVPTNVGNTNARTITLDTGRLPGSYTATWVDPTDATSSQSASINGSGEVTTPSTHSDGTRDWLLVIRAS